MSSKKLRFSLLAELIPFSRINYSFSASFSFCSSLFRDYLLLRRAAAASVAVSRHVEKLQELTDVQIILPTKYVKKNAFKVFA
jgi:hypothetical protein